MTNTAVHRIRQKIPSLLVIARCSPDAEKMINTQRNKAMCVDIFLIERADRLTRSALSALTVPR